MTHFRRFRGLFAILMCLVLVGSVSAQGSATINIGENKAAELTAALPSLTFAVNIPSPQVLTVQALSLTAGFAPTVRVANASGVIMQTLSNVGGQTVVAAPVNFTAAGLYRIEVSSSSGGLGQFILSVQPGQSLQPPQPLILGQPVFAEVDPQTALRAYSFTGVLDEILLLTLRSDLPNSGPIVTLKDAETGETLVQNGSRLIGLRYRLPALVGIYRVEVMHSGSASSEPFVICLETESGSTRCPVDAAIGQNAPTATPTLIPPSPTIAAATFEPVQIPPGGPCAVASASGATINIRSGPSTNDSIIGRLGPTVIAPVIGRLGDNTWFQINLNGVIGFVSATVVRIGGNCGGVPIVVMTPTPTTAATFTPSATPTGTTSATPTNTPTSTPTTPAPMATLNFSLPAVYGSTALTSGFVPDPFAVGITAGGPANVSYLGGGCSGYTTSAPSFSVNYTSGPFPTLRFYFIGSGDTTMIINSPSGSYFCVDDSFGTLNPTIDFNSPASGRYDVWIGTFNPGGSVGGTLYVTENTGNHP